MASIVHQEKIINFNRIVFYGCSLTAGSEVGNETFLNDNFKKKYKLEDIDKVKKNYSRTDFLKKFINAEISTLENYSKERSWANKLSAMFNVNCINRSIPAGNNQLSVYNLNLDISLKKINHDDLIIVGISPYKRWMWIDASGGVHKTIFDWDNDWPSNIFYHEYLRHLSNDNQFFYDNYLSIKYLDLLSKNLNNRILLQFMFKNWTVEETLSSNHKLLANEVFDFKSIIDCDFSFDKIVKNWIDDVHGYGHPKEEHHKIMAEHLYKRLVKNEN